MLKILVPTSGQAAAEDTADYAMQVASALNADILALHVIKPGNSKEAGELSLQYFTNAGRTYDVDVETEFREGSVIKQIVGYAAEREVDLIVMGASHGRVLDQWLVSDVRDNTEVPVLVIPYQIFGSDN